MGLFKKIYKAVSSVGKKIEKAVKKAGRDIDKAVIQPIVSPFKTPKIDLGPEEYPDETVEQEEGFLLPPGLPRMEPARKKRKQVTPMDYSYFMQNTSSTIRALLGLVPRSSEDLLMKRRVTASE